MKKRLLVILAAALAGYWAYLQLQERRAAQFLYQLGSRPTEAAVEQPQVELTPHAGSIHSYGLTAGALIAIVIGILMVLAVVADPSIPRVTPTPTPSSVASRVCQTGFPACPFSVIVEAIKTATANGETVPCTYHTDDGVDVLDNAYDPACRRWLYGEE